jgi:5-methylcytosine-specific restriction endonuclease McrA
MLRLKGEAMSSLRRLVFSRDDMRCVRCGARVNWATGELAHIQGRGRGGDDSPENTETCCKVCHRAEHHPKAIRPA